MFDLLRDIKTLLTGITPDIYKDDMPDSPDNLVCLYTTGGYGAEFCFGQQQPMFETLSFQVAVRNKSRDGALAVIEQIDTALNGRADQVINGNRYLLITKQGDFHSLGKDATGRSEFTANYTTKLQKGGF